MTKLAVLVLTCPIAACGPAVDLPEGWEGAVGIEDFIQYACDGSPSDDGWTSTVTATAIQPGLRVIGNDLPFRCEQEVEGYYRVDGEAVDLLVQPVDMDPEEVAACDCLVEVEAGVPEEPPATVSLYRRSDHYGQNDDAPSVPEWIGSVDVP